MLDPANALVPPPCSPTNSSSSSSSDLDTESTGSFFHDRSTTLGTLMGVNFPAIAFRVPSQRGESVAAAAAVGNDSGGGGGGRRRGDRALVSVAERRRRRWWSLCRDDYGSRPSSLGEFLEVERRFGDVALFGAELEGGGGGRAREGGMLFADGRVLPPRQAAEEAATGSSGGALCRFHVSLTGICSGGAG
ncbi:hypothetical protein RHGRI_034619 [Rhododendron griersonianum]|uniref:Uncharacterized protein n=1 Tax=Rhododendron griersonianum TaxID=479676 RepID=A0AAV6I1U1_9ERIC|nr:hypothetical protein RHGRI_034619 [Rhododendron griersonianum]